MLQIEVLSSQRLTTSRMSIDLLLDDLELVDYTDNGVDLVIQARQINYSTTCPHCKSNNTLTHGQRDHNVEDLPAYGRRTHLIIRQPRLRCKDCGKTFIPRLDCVEENGRITKRLREHICSAFRHNRTFSSMANEYNVSETTIKRIFNEYVSQKEKECKKDIKTPTCMGIDEAHLNKNMRCVIVDLEKGGLIEILESRRKDTVVDYFKSYSHPELVRIVTMDMWLPYKQAVRECFPEAKIVIDRFHVVQLANSAMDGIRVRFAKSRPASERKEIYDSRGLLNCAKERLKIQEYVKLENLLAKYPELETAYNLKERFRKIYYSSTREVAEMFFAEWEEDIPERMTEFLSVAQTVHNWFEEIFNFFDDNYTNAMSESINNLIKAAQKQGRGYSFEILRAKMLYDNMCVRKPKYFKKPDNAMSYMTYMTLNQKPKMISGYMVDIDMLTKWLESDDF